MPFAIDHFDYLFQTHDRHASSPRKQKDAKMTEDRHPAAYEDAVEDRAILSFSLLLAALLAGFVISLGIAETNHVLTTLVSILN